MSTPPPVPFSPRPFTPSDSATQQRLMQVFDDDDDFVVDGGRLSSSSSCSSTLSINNEEDEAGDCIANEDEDCAMSQEILFSDDEDYQRLPGSSSPPPVVIPTEEEPTVKDVVLQSIVDCTTPETPTRRRSARRASQKARSPAPTKPVRARKDCEAERLHKQRRSDMMATLANVIKPIHTTNPRCTGRPPLKKQFKSTASDAAQPHTPSATILVDQEATIPKPPSPLVSLFKDPSMRPKVRINRDKEWLPPFKNVLPQHIVARSTTPQRDLTKMCKTVEDLSKKKSQALPPRDSRLYSSEEVFSSSSAPAGGDPQTFGQSVNMYDKLLAASKSLAASDASSFGCQKQKLPLINPTEMIYLISQREVEFRELQRRCKMWLPEHGAMACNSNALMSAASLTTKRTGPEQTRLILPKRRAQQTKITRDLKTGIMKIQKDSRAPIEGGYMYHEDEMFPAEIFPISCTAAVMVKNTQRLRMLPNDEFGFLMFPCFHVAIKGYNATNIYGLDRDFDKLHDAYLFTLCKLHACENKTSSEHALLEQHRNKLLSQITQRRNVLLERIFRRWRLLGAICACSNSSCFQHNKDRPELYVYNGLWYIDRGSYSSPFLYQRTSAIDSIVTPAADEEITTAIRSTNNASTPMIDLEFQTVLKEASPEKDAGEEQGEEGTVRLEPLFPSDELLLNAKHALITDDDLDMMMLLNTNPFEQHHQNQGVSCFGSPLVSEHEFLAPSLDLISNSLNEYSGGDVFSHYFHFD